jgi:hypothetical protein
VPASGSVQVNTTPVRASLGYRRTSRLRPASAGKFAGSLEAESKGLRCRAVISDPSRRGSRNR